MATDEQPEGSDQAKPSAGPRKGLYPWGNTPSGAAKRREQGLKTYSDYTIQALRLDVDAAEAGRLWLLLPRKVRMEPDGPETYPLPSDIGELGRVARLKIGRARNAGAVYVRRAAVAHKNRIQRVKETDYEMSHAEALEARDKAVEAGKAAQ